MTDSVWLFNDNDGENGELFVHSIAVYNREITAEEAGRLGGVQTTGLPLFIPEPINDITEPTISLERNKNEITIRFEGLLQSSPNVNGPWKDLNQESPAVIPTDETRQFFRSRN